MKRQLFLPFLLLISALPVLAQQADSLILEGKALIRQAAQTNDAEALLQARAILLRVTHDADHAALAHYYLARVEEQQMNFNRGDKDTVLEHLNQGLDHLEAATEADPQFADAYALLGSLLGQKAGYQPMRSMFLGPKSDRMFEKALDLEPENPRVVLLKAVSHYYKPRMFGGSRRKALEGFEHAAALAEVAAYDDPARPDWGHADAYAWIGLAHMDADRPEQAQAAFDQALRIDPDYAWVKYVLLPALASE